MNLQIEFTFYDGITFNLKTCQDEIGKNLKDIEKGCVCWKDGSGFWIDFPKVRYFTVREIDE